MLVADISKVSWKEIQVRMKEVYYQQHIALYHSVGFKYLLYQLFVVGWFVIAQKALKNQFECFPCCLLSSF
jgi:hypothetical protein